MSGHTFFFNTVYISAIAAGKETRTWSNPSVCFVAATYMSLFDVVVVVVAAVAVVVVVVVVVVAVVDVVVVVAAVLLAVIVQVGSTPFTISGVSL